MSTGTLRGATLAVACALVVASAAPALAEAPTASPTAPELAAVSDVPAALAADLSIAEEDALAELTAGDGVGLSALVETARGAQVVSLDADTRSQAEEAVALLDAQPSVQAADVAVRMHVTAGSLAQFGNVMVRSDAARADVGDAIADVVVAVVDTGVSAHTELADALLPGYNALTGGSDASDDQGHGTHVAGTIGADAGSQVEGVAAGVRILPVKVLDDTGSGYSTDIAAGIVWAADHGADVINMSLGGYGDDGVMGAAVEYARSKGVTVVAAAGNFNRVDPFYPADYEGVVGVSAVDAQQAKAGFSNFGPFVDVAAPGVGIVSTLSDGGYGPMNGTSMAAPHVAAVAALAKAVGPDLTPDEVELALEGSASDLGARGRDDVFGRGLVDAVAAVSAARALQDSGLWPDNEAPVAPDLTRTSQYTPGNLPIDVLAEASDPDGDDLTIKTFGQGTNGAVRAEDGRLVWRPLRSGPYTDTFTYTVDDGFGRRATGTVTVSVGAPDPANGAPVAVTDEVEVPFEWEATIAPLLSNDSDPDGDPLRIVSFTQPEHGSLRMDWDGLRYWKQPAVTGADVDSYTYTVTDDRGRFATAEVHIAVRTPNTLPVAVDDEYEVVPGTEPVYLHVTENDSDVDPQDPLRIWDVGPAQHGEAVQMWIGWVRWTPSRELPVGTTDTFTYTLYDTEFVPVRATVHITIVEPSAPSAPTLGTVTPGNGSAVVRWSAPDDLGTSPMIGYEIAAYAGGKFAGWATTGDEARSVRVTGLANGRAHTFRVVAVNMDGSSPAAISAAVTPRTKPGAPKRTSVTSARKALVVRWSAPANTGGAAITGYLVRTYKGYALVKSTKVSASARALTVRGLTAGQSYRVRVQAINVVDGGLWSSASKVVRPKR